MNLFHATERCTSAPEWHHACPRTHGIPWFAQTAGKRAEPVLCQVLQFLHVSPTSDHACPHFQNRKTLQHHHSPLLPPYGPGNPGKSRSDPPGTRCTIHKIGIGLASSRIVSCPRRLPTDPNSGQRGQRSRTARPTPGLHVPSPHVCCIRSCSRTVCRPGDTGYPYRVHCSIEPPPPKIPFGGARIRSYPRRAAECAVTVRNEGTLPHGVIHGYYVGRACRYIYAESVHCHHRER